MNKYENNHRARKSYAAKGIDEGMNKWQTKDERHTSKTKQLPTSEHAHVCDSSNSSSTIAMRRTAYRHDDNEQGHEEVNKVQDIQ